MAQYIFTKDSSIGTYVPPTSGAPSNLVNFKKGDIIEGTFVHVEAQSESDYVETQTPKGKVRIPFGGRGGSVITAYSQTDSAAKDTTIKNGSGLEKTQTKAINFFTTKNIIIGVLVVGAIFGILKFTKKI